MLRICQLCMSIKNQCQVRVALVREATEGTELQGSTAHRVFTKAEIRCPAVVVVIASCCGFVRVKGKIDIQEFIKSWQSYTGEDQNQEF